MRLVPAATERQAAPTRAASDLGPNDRTTNGLSSHVIHAIAVLRGVGRLPSRPLSANEGDALGVIYRSYGGMLLTVLRQLLGSQADAEDALHEVFARLPWIITLYREHSFGGWLRQLSVRLALTRLRSTRRRRESTFADVQDLVDDRVSTTDFDALQRRDLVRDAIEQLSEPLRQVVILRIFFEFSHQQIGDVLGISPTASEVRMCRALKQLRALLRQSVEVHRECV